MIKLLFLLNSFSPAQLFNPEFTDYTIAVGAATYPKSGGASAEAATSFYLWGKKSENNFRYGYVRPYLVGATSITVNQGEVGLQIFPISIFGVTLSHKVSTRSKDFDGLPCNTNNCLGDIRTSSVKTHLVFGYENWFALYKTQFAAAEHLDKTQNFIDENTMLINDKNGDHYFYSDVILGYRLNPDLSFGVNFNDTKITTSLNSNLMRSVFVSYKQGKELNYIFGVGYYESSVQAREFTVYGVFRWLLGSSLDLTR